jgi:hypothetical protein
MYDFDEAKETAPVYSANAERAIALVLKPSFLHIYLSLKKVNFTYWKLTIITYVCSYKDI